ncbi:hypothetical protein Ato02nite_047940 [Paractinoplanes toevensis]|uniref:SMP-30/Gluconolactonase/LRE-like region domain-containing protein n=1 Tax=Paractinoplanes toevensis TaxID=571911 RepID=A0A919TDT8_9ACTN|nr:hypothetical protein Ato02nite_047940 [Actinoplanes toevensis]
MLQGAVVPVLALGFLGASAVPALGAAATIATYSVVGVPRVIGLPGATSAEGVAAGAGPTFYATDLFNGDIFRGDIRSGAVEKFIDAPDGSQAAGLKADVRHGLLFVAGSFSGQAYVYNLRTGALLATYQLAPDGDLINDVAVTAEGAWLTDSAEAKLFFIPVDGHGRLGAARTLMVTGPAADTSGTVNLNGIVAAPDGRTLIVAHTPTGRLYRVNPATGASDEIQGIDVPNVDGLVLDGHRLWAVRAADNLIVRFQLNSSLTQGVQTKVISSPAFGFPTTAALFGDRLAAVNAHFESGIPSTSPTYEVVVVNS